MKIELNRKHTSKELKSTNNQLANLHDLNSDGSHITATYINEELGKSVVEATYITDSLKNNLIKKYGDILDIRLDTSYKDVVPTFTRTDNFGVLGGGIAIKNSGCTMAATATSGTTKFIITAGHCLSGNGTTTINQNTTAVGVDWAKATTHDIGLIKVTASNRWISNKILKTSPNIDYDAKYTGTNTATQGQTLCKSGITTQTTCFKVLSTSINTSLFQDQIKVENPYSQNQDYGDSGAPLYDSSSKLLYGIMSSKSTTNDANTWATATKISYFSYYWPSYSLYTSDSNY